MVPASLLWTAVGWWTVSYTHLDVYKRQDKRLGLLDEDGFAVPIKPVEDLAGASIILDNAALLRLKSFFGDEGGE